MPASRLAALALGLALWPGNVLMAQGQPPAAPAAVKPAPENVMALDPNVAWWASSWGDNSGALCEQDEDAVESHIFTVTEPQKRLIWVYYFSSPVPLDDSRSW